MTYIMKYTNLGNYDTKSEKFVNRALMFARGRRLEARGYEVHYYKVKVEELKDEKK